MSCRRHPNAIWRRFFADQQRLAEEDGESWGSDSPARLAAAASAALGIHRKRPADDNRPFASLLPAAEAERWRRAAGRRRTGDSQGVVPTPAEPSDAQRQHNAASSSCAPATGASEASPPREPAPPAEGESAADPPKRWRAGRKRGSGKCRRARQAAAAAALREVEALPVHRVPKEESDSPSPELASTIGSLPGASRRELPPPPPPPPRRYARR